LRVQTVRQEQTKPRSDRGGMARRRSRATSRGRNHSGTAAPGPEVAEWSADRSSCAVSLDERKRAPDIGAGVGRPSRKRDSTRIGAQQLVPAPTETGGSAPESAIRWVRLGAAIRAGSQLEGLGWRWRARPPTRGAAPRTGDHHGVGGSWPSPPAWRGPVPPAGHHSAGRRQRSTRSRALSCQRHVPELGRFWRCFSGPRTAQAAPAPRGLRPGRGRGQHQRRKETHKQPCSGTACA